MHPYFVVFKGHQKHLDVLHVRFGLTWSVLVAPYCLKQIADLPINNTSETLCKNNVNVSKTTEKE